MKLRNYSFQCGYLHEVSAILQYLAQAWFADSWKAVSKFSVTSDGSLYYVNLTTTLTYDALIIVFNKAVGDESYHMARETLKELP